MCVRVCVCVCMCVCVCVCVCVQNLLLYKQQLFYLCPIKKKVIHCDRLFFLSELELGETTQNKTCTVEGVICTVWYCTGFI